MRFSKEEEYLRQKDKKLKKIIDTNGHIVFKNKKLCGQRQNRTADPLFFRQVLYRLSYLA